MAPGTRLGPYEVTTLIGTGGMGEVYRARDPRLLALLDIGTRQGSPYIVSELLEGKSLLDRLKGGGLTVRRAG